MRFMKRINLKNLKLKMHLAIKDCHERKDFCSTKNSEQVKFWKRNRYICKKKNMHKKIRVRFAPSPTGPLHVGGVRTALFNYLFAKKNGGDFILRIEDTDQARYVKGAEEYIIESLKWCGLHPDEGVGAGGSFGPYRQSERKEMYKEYAYRLVENGHAYFAFDTPSELEAMRERLKQESSSNQQYGVYTRQSMKNSLSLSVEEVQKRLHEGQEFVIRVKIPEDTQIHVKDLIRGDVVFESNLLDDKVLYKSDGMPTYHLANIVDDHLMQISHVIRGEEWLPSLPLHKLLYQFFGWLDTMPQFAHLPLILKPDGKGKLSKRDGDKGGFPVFPLQWKDPDTGELSSGYREAGYFADAFINIMALLGWNPGTEQEIFSLDELIQAFSIDKVGKSGSKFDPDKAKWFNHQYLIKKTDAELAQVFIQDLKSRKIESSIQKVTKIISLVKERATFISDFWEHSSFLFERPSAYDEKMHKKSWKTDTSVYLNHFINLLNDIEVFKSAVIEQKTKDWFEAKALPIGQFMAPLRLSLVGTGKGPHIFDIVEVLGKDETISRIKQAIDTLGA
jgi:glutamyl-tRNA synthetase